MTYLSCAMPPHPPASYRARLLLFWGACTAPAASFAEGINLFGPTQGEVLLLVALPLLGSAVLVLAMLATKGGFMALLGGCFLAAMWVVAALASIQTFGFLMFLFAPWALFVCLLLAYVTLIRRSEPPSRDAQAGSAGLQALSPEGVPQGRCPNCEVIIALASAECPRCQAQFSAKAAWRVEPL